MNNKCLMVICLLSMACAEKQVKLEDIEHDNLINEHRTKIEGNHSHRLHVPPSPQPSAPASYESSGESRENELNQDIVYAQGGNSAEQYDKTEQHVQYVTPNQLESAEYTAQPQQEYTPQVHEASSHTYPASSRESLINPIIHKPISTPSPYLSQQPRYVYVQAGPQQLQPNGVLTYEQSEVPSEYQQQQQQQQPQQPLSDDIEYANIQQNHLLENSPQSTIAPTRPDAIHGQQNYVQYVPFLTQTASGQNIIMLIRNIPTHSQAFSIPPVSSSPQHEIPIPNQHLAAPQPTISYVNHNSLEETAVLQVPESTAIPLQHIPFPQPVHQPIHQHLHQIPQPIQPLHIQPQIQYAGPTQQPIEYQLQPQRPSFLQSHHFTPTLDMFGNINKHATSLLDSYIPSSVILARQRNLLSHGRHHLPSFAYSQPTHLIHQGSHQPGYNTIAYSTYQGPGGYSKRSALSAKKNQNNNNIKQHNNSSNSSNNNNNIGNKKS